MKCSCFPTSQLFSLQDLFVFNHFFFISNLQLRSWKRLICSRTSPSCFKLENIKIQQVFHGEVQITSRASLLVSSLHCSITSSRPGTKASWTIHTGLMEICSCLYTFLAAEHISTSLQLALSAAGPCTFTSDFISTRVWRSDTALLYLFAGLQPKSDFTLPSLCAHCPETALPKMQTSWLQNESQTAVSTLGGYASKVTTLRFSLAATICVDAACRHVTFSTSITLKGASRTPAESGLFPPDSLSPLTSRQLPLFQNVQLAASQHCLVRAKCCRCKVERGIIYRVRGLIFLLWHCIISSITWHYD